LRRVDELWRTRRGDIGAAARNVVVELRRGEEPSAATALDEEVLRRGQAQLAGSFDRVNAGFSGAPKFPRPVTLHFLLRGFARDASATSAGLVLATLTNMARGGLFDHLGGGFHRYSVDATWHVPHFEKMLYDQAQLVQSYIDGHAISGEP